VYHQPLFGKQYRLKLGIDNSIDSTRLRLINLFEYGAQEWTVRIKESINSREVVVPGLDYVFSFVTGITPLFEESV